MKQTPQPPVLRAELVDLVVRGGKRARVMITGTSMEPLLRAGMVIEIEALGAPPRVGDILVFRSQTGLVAHRLVGGELFALRAHSGVVARRLLNDATAAFVTSGDARPDRCEIVPKQRVVGRVCAVWASAEPGAARIDGAHFDRLGAVLARTRAVRSMIVKLRAYGRVVSSLLVRGPATSVPMPVFAGLIAATTEFERGHDRAGVERLAMLPRAACIDVGRRHHASGFISDWLDRAARAGVPVPADLREPFGRIRWTNALQAGRVLACVRDVRDRFVAAHIPHVFLKGGARLAADQAGADLQFSGDVDVLVPAEMAERAQSTLRHAGYRDVQTARWRRNHLPWMHHREPLISPEIGVPVEVHVYLAPPNSVGAVLDYPALVAFARRVHGPIGATWVLDEVASAVHLAYHARDLHVWRDIVLLSRLLRGFDRAARSRFDRFVRAEQRDRPRLESAVAAAEAITSDTVDASRAVSRYLAWVVLREDIPRRFGYPDLAEALIGRCAAPKLRLHDRRDVAMWLRCWIRNIVMLPMLLRLARQLAKNDRR